MLKTLHVSDACHAALAAEYTGNYEAGLIELAGFWDYRNPDEAPNAEGLTRREIGELLLRGGALYGFYGGSRRDFQEKSKDLVTQAFTYFDELRDAVKQRECANYLALCYSRLENKENTEAWLSFSLDCPEPDSVYLHALVIGSIVSLNAGEPGAVARRLEEHRKHFEASRSPFLKACFYTNLGLAQKNTGHTEAALENLIRGHELFSSLNHRHYLASLENNLARLYQKRGLKGKALEHLARGLKIAEELGDNQKLGAMYDTMAQIVFEEKAYPVALQYSEKAVAALEKTEFYGYLVEALETKIKCLVRMDHLKEALETFALAVAVAARETGKALLSRVKNSFATELRKTRILKLYREGGNFDFVGDFNLIFEDGRRLGGKIKVVETTSNLLREYGIEAGDLLVVDVAEVTDGDLIALKIKSDKSAYIGFLFTDEKVRRIELRQNDPERSRSFDLKDVELLGKIIGMTRFGEANRKELRVRPLNIKR